MDDIPLQDITVGSRAKPLSVMSDHEIADAITQGETAIRATGFTTVHSLDRAYAEVKRYVDENDRRFRHKTDERAQFAAEAIIKYTRLVAVWTGIMAVASIAAALATWVAALHH